MITIEHSSREMFCRAQNHYFTLYFDIETKTEDGAQASKRYVNIRLVKKASGAKVHLVRCGKTGRLEVQTAETKVVLKDDCLYVSPDYLPVPARGVSKCVLEDALKPHHNRTKARLLPIFKGE